MPVIKDGQIAEDPWVRLADEAPLPSGGPVIVSLERFKAAREEVLAHEGPIGLALKAGERAHDIAGDARHFALILLEMPVFRDGRAFSAARLLRDRYGFAGDIRASGHVLPDQALFFERCGVTSFEIADPARAAAFAEMPKHFSVVLQPTGHGRRLPLAPAERRAGASHVLQAAE